MTQNQEADLFTNDVDIVVYSEFASIDALYAYKRHPTYVDVSNTVRPPARAALCGGRPGGMSCGSRLAGLAPGGLTR